jgi:hypothetical protein
VSAETFNSIVVLLTLIPWVGLFVLVVVCFALDVRASQRTERTQAGPRDRAVSAAARGVLSGRR